jgi:hypothetical protein
VRQIIATGEIDGGIFVVVYTWRSGRRQIISARPGRSAMSSVRRTRTEIRKRGGGRVDWTRVEKAPDGEIDEMIASNVNYRP